MLLVLIFKIFLLHSFIIFLRRVLIKRVSYKLWSWRFTAIAVTISTKERLPLPLLWPKTATHLPPGKYDPSWSKQTHPLTLTPEHQVSTWSVLNVIVRINLHLEFEKLLLYSGTTQGIAIIENLMEHLAKVCKKDPLAYRLQNFNSSPAMSPLRQIIDQIRSSSEYDQRLKEVGLSENSYFNYLFYFNIDKK